MHTVLLGVLILLFCVFVGYFTGRRQGLKVGREHGKAEASLSLRADSLRAGTCKICDRTYV